MVESNKKKKGKKTQVTPDVKSKQKKMTSRNSAQPNSLQQPQVSLLQFVAYLFTYLFIFMKSGPYGFPVCSSLTLKAPVTTIVAYFLICLWF